MACVLSALAVYSVGEAQIPADLIAIPGQSPPQGYNSADPRFGAPELCKTLNGEITDADGGRQVCSGIDINNTFCIAGSEDAFPCRGLYKHVIACNNGYNRPAMNPFLCAAPCDAQTERALGDQCAVAVNFAEAVPANLQTVSYDVSLGFSGAVHTVVVGQSPRPYSLLFPEDMKTDGFTLNAVGNDWEFKVVRPLTGIFKISAVGRIVCDGCRPEFFTVAVNLVTCGPGREENPFDLGSCREVFSCPGDRTETADRVCELQCISGEEENPFDENDCREVFSCPGDRTETADRVCELQCISGEEENPFDENDCREVFSCPGDRTEMADQVCELQCGSGEEENPFDVNDCREVFSCPGDRTETADRVCEWRCAPSGKASQCSNLPDAADGNDVGCARSLIGGGHGVSKFTCRVYESVYDDTLKRDAGFFNSSSACANTVMGHADWEYDDWIETLPMLHYAIMTNACQVAELLIEKGANIHALGHKAWTPLHWAAARNNLTVASLLLEKGANVNAKHSFTGNITPLFYAARENSAVVASLLLKNGADINAKDRYGDTPLHYAMEQGGTEVAILLLKNGAEVNGKGISDETPLSYAVRWNSVVIVSLLLERGADVNVTTGFLAGDTPLHRAARQGGAEVAKLLIDAGADVNAKNNDGDTPLDMAIEEEHAEMQALLRQHGGECNTNTEC